MKLFNIFILLIVFSTLVSFLFVNDSFSYSNSIDNLITPETNELERDSELNDIYELREEELIIDAEDVNTNNEIIETNREVEVIDEEYISNELYLTQWIRITNYTTITNRIEKKRPKYIRPSYRPVLFTLIYPGVGQIKLKQYAKGSVLAALFSWSFLGGLSFYISSNKYYNRAQELWDMAKTVLNESEREKCAEESYANYDKYVSYYSCGQVLLWSSLIIYLYNIFDCYYTIRWKTKLEFNSYYDKRQYNYSMMLRWYL